MYGSVTYLVISTGSITPDMTKVQPMAYFVRGCSSFIKRCTRCTCSSECIVVDHYTVSRRTAAGELRIAEVATAQVTNPKIEFGSGAGGCNTLRTFFHGIIECPACFGCTPALYCIESKRTLMFPDFTLLYVD